MVPIDSSWVVIYSTFTDLIIVSVTVFEIFRVKFYDFEQRKFKVILVKIHSVNRKRMVGQPRS